MKKFLKINFFVLMAALASITLASCLDSDPVEYPPVNVADIPGNYSGKIVINHNDLTRENLILHTTTVDHIKFSEFPMMEIVSSIEPNAVDAAAIVKEMGQVAYEFPYETKVRQEYGGAELLLKPQPMELTIPMKNGAKKAVVTLSAKEAGFYSTVEHAMAIRLVVDEISVDGVKMETFRPITYTLPYSTKTK